MRLSLRTLVLSLFAVVCLSAWGQSVAWSSYKVKKKDTIYGIAKKHDVTVEELMEANPQMRAEGYVLQKGSEIRIPTAWSNRKAANEAGAKSGSASAAAPQKHVIHVGIMLPLHNVDGDGRRMTEYYRGVLMACDSLRAQGISTDIHAWNLSIDANATQIINDPQAAKCDIIFGPLYSKQVHLLAEFCKARGIKLVIPFSISGDDVSIYPQIFQVYQSDDRLANGTIELYLKRFANAHPVFIDCNDKTSRKGGFTFGLRTRLEAKGISYGLTNLNSSADAFVKQFSRSQQNVVILNTGRSPELTAALKKLDELSASQPGLRISLFGYTEWLMYLAIDAAKFHRYDAYIPSTFFYNPADIRTRQLEQSYQRWFHAPMMQALPRFAITGYDQAQFFLRGIAKQGKKFKGTKGSSTYRFLQSPLEFKQILSAGMQNEFLQLIHFTPAGNIESIAY